jgi:hypothetical protein
VVNGSAWVTLASGNSALSGGGLSAQIGEILFFPYVGGGNPIVGMYAGSLKAAAYTTGTITVTNGSKTVAGVGTSWLAGVDAGMILNRLSDYGVVKSVDSNTQITLADPWQGATQARGARIR